MMLHLSCMMVTVVTVMSSINFQLTFSVCIGASFCCLDNHVETMTNNLTNMKRPCGNTFLKRAVVNLLLENGCYCISNCRLLDSLVV